MMIAMVQWKCFNIRNNSTTLCSSQGTSMYQLTPYYYGTLSPLHFRTPATFMHTGGIAVTKCQVGRIERKQTGFLQLLKSDELPIYNNPTEKRLFKFRFIFATELTVNNSF